MIRSDIIVALDGPIGSARAAAQDRSRTAKPDETSLPVLTQRQGRGRRLPNRSHLSDHRTALRHFREIDSGRFTDVPRGRRERPTPSANRRDGPGTKKPDGTDAGRTVRTGSALDRDDRETNAGRCR